MAIVPKISDAEFLEMCDIIKNRAGLFFGADKKSLFESRLRPRLRELNLNSFTDYIHLLRLGPNGRNNEMVLFINSLTTNETYFLRERSQLDYLAKTVVPSMKSNGKSTIKILSAPCSSGEEPYSIKIALSEANSPFLSSCQVFGTDINTFVLEHAQAAIYRSLSFRGVPDEVRDKYFTLVTQSNSYSLKPNIKMGITFKQANFVTDSLYTKFGTKFDIIFTRNVLVYFDTPGRQKIIDNLYNSMNPGGILFLGHSETLTGINTKFVYKMTSGVVYYLRGD